MSADYERGGGRTSGELEPRILLAGHNGLVMPLRDRGTRRRRGTVAVGLLATLLPLELSPSEWVRHEGARYE